MKNIISLFALSYSNANSDNRQINPPKDSINQEAEIDLSRQQSNQIIDKLKGSWKSTEDESYSIVISDRFIIDKYVGNVRDSSTYKVLNKSDEGNKIRFYLISKGIHASDTISYEIMNVTSESLTLLYLDRGNTLEFIRYKQ